MKPAHPRRIRSVRRREHPHRETRAHPEPRTEGGGGSSGRGPVDDDDRGGRKPERPDDQRALIVVLGILAVGAGVMSARLLASAGRRRSALRP